MDAPYQARDEPVRKPAGSGGVSICEIMPTNIVEVKRLLLHPVAVLRGVNELGRGLAQVGDDGDAQLRHDSGGVAVPARSRVLQSHIAATRVSQLVFSF